MRGIVNKCLSYFFAISDFFSNFESYFVLIYEYR